MSAPPPHGPAPSDDNQPSADARLRLINARAARTIFASCAGISAIGALLLFAGHVYRAMDTLDSAVLWAGFSVLSTALCFLPPRSIERGGLALFLAGSVTALLVNAVLRGQGVQTVGLLFLPLLLMVGALLLRLSQALLLATAALVGLIVLHRAPALGWWSVSVPPSDADTHLIGLTLSSAMALLMGLLAAIRFAQAARLSAQHEVRYRDLFDRIPSGVVLHDDGRVLDTNRAALKILGESRRSALIGRNLREYLADPEAQDRFNRRAQQLAEGPDHEVLPLEDMALRRRDGNLIQVRSSATVMREIELSGLMPLLLGTGRAQRPLFLSFMLDDTQRLLAQAETARVRALLEVVLSHSPYALCLTRRQDARIVECNQAYESLVGRTRGELLGHSEIELGIWTRPGDRDHLMAALGEEPTAGEQLLRLNRSNGQRRLVKGRGALLSFDGEDYLLLIGRDVTDILRREAEQQTVLAHAPLGVATTLGVQIVSANPRLHEMFGLAPGQMIGMQTRELWADRAGHDARQSQVLRDLAQRGYARFEDEFVLQDRRVVVRATGRPIPDAGEGPRSVVWIMEDITQDREAEQALQAAVRAAQSASRAKSAFLANMSHELRTPLNGILGLLDMALDSDQGADRQRHLELARESSRMLADLLSDVLDLSKIEAGRLVIDRAPFDLRVVIDSLQAVHVVLAEHRGLRLLVEADFGAPGPFWVQGDALRVRQILGNFLSNALKFTAAGEVVLRARVLPHPSLQILRFEVQDTGSGIDRALHGRLFEAFEQGDASSTRRQGGTGLGLAICRELAALMGGRVGLESELGRGSLFWAELPLPGAPADTLGWPEAPADISLDGLRLLVAEDNPVNMLITSTMLERAGARVTGVADGQLAVREVLRADEAGDPYAALLMDIQMPAMDGLQATQALRLTHPTQRLPIIALTAGALQAERDAALQAGMDDFITKPVDRHGLLACVDRHVRQARAAGPPAQPPQPLPTAA